MFTLHSACLWVCMACCLRSLTISIQCVFGIRLFVSEICQKCVCFRCKFSNRLHWPERQGKWGREREKNCPIVDSKCLQLMRLPTQTGRFYCTVLENNVCSMVISVFWIMITANNISTTLTVPARLFALHTIVCVFRSYLKMDRTLGWLEFVNSMIRLSHRNTPSDSCTLILHAKCCIFKS